MGRDPPRCTILLSTQGRLLHDPDTFPECRSVLGQHAVTPWLHLIISGWNPSSMATSATSQSRDPCTGRGKLEMPKVK